MRADDIMDGGARQINAQRGDPLQRKISAIRYSIYMCVDCGRKPRACPRCQKMTKKIEELKAARVVWLAAQVQR